LLKEKFQRENDVYVKELPRMTPDAMEGGKCPGRVDIELEDDRRTPRLAFRVRDGRRDRDGLLNFGAVRR
jgi:hypothetical protein